MIHIYAGLAFAILAVASWLGFLGTHDESPLVAYACAAVGSVSVFTSLIACSGVSRQPQEDPSSSADEGRPDSDEPTSEIGQRLSPGAQIIGAAVG